MIKVALVLLATTASIPAFAQSTPGVPFGTRCPVALPLGTTFLNTTSAPTGTTINIWDGAQCVPWMGLNQTAHTLTLGSTSNRFTNVYGVLGNFSGDLTTDITGSTQCVVANSSGVLSGAGSTCAPGYTPSALTRTNDTNVTLTLGGTPATALLQATSITAGWSGTLAVARGGTGGGTASGTLLDNITGFASTGFLTRTGSGTYAFQSATNGVTLGNLAQSSANTILGNWTGSTANVAANAMPSCADSGGNHLNYVSGTGVTCGTGGSGISALTGDVTASGTGSVAATLATVNASPGSSGSSTAIPTVTVNGKGLVTSVTTNAVIAPAGTLSGTTLNSTVVTSSLTAVGTIGTGVWQGTPVAGLYGGTGLSTAAVGDIMYASATTPTWARLADVAVGSVLVSGGTSTAPAYSANPTVTTIKTGAGAANAPSHIVGNATTGLYSVSTTGFGMTVNGAVQGDYGITSTSNWTLQPGGTSGPLTVTTSGVGGQVILDVVPGAGATNYIRSAANLIPHANNTYSLGLAGDVWAALYINAGTGTNADFLCLSAAGLVLIQTTSCTISTLRLKPDWKLYKQTAMSAVKKLEIGTFHLADSIAAHNKDPNARTLQIGLNAENIARVLPEAAVYEDDMTTPKSYRQESMLALYAKALQELSNDVVRLRLEIKKIKNAHPAKR